MGVRTQKNMREKSLTLNSTQKYHEKLIKLIEEFHEKQPKAPLWLSVCAFYKALCFVFICAEKDSVHIH